GVVAEAGEQWVYVVGVVAVYRVSEAASVVAGQAVFTGGDSAAGAGAARGGVGPDRVGEHGGPLVGVVRAAGGSAVARPRGIVQGQSAVVHHAAAHGRGAVLAERAIQQFGAGAKPNRECAALSGLIAGQEHLEQVERTHLVVDAASGGGGGVAFQDRGDK